MFVQKVTVDFLATQTAPQAAGSERRSTTTQSIVFRIGSRRFPQNGNLLP